MRQGIICSVVTTILVSVGVAARAQDADLLAKLRACAMEAKDSRRLACYDGQLRPSSRKPQEGQTAAAAAAAATAAAPAAPASVAPAAATPATAAGSVAATAPTAAAAAAATQEQQFGMDEQNARKAAQAPRLRQLTSRVETVSYPRGTALVKLENGQLWEVVEGEESISLEPGTAVSLRAGVFGAYYLSVKKTSVRVKRLK